uniref:Uncharacterized protein n=1 Tax=Bracon brevicornis TaxID=1563983 RepID=A0A6V7JEG6_9HYME
MSGGPRNEMRDLLMKMEKLNRDIEEHSRKHTHLLNSVQELQEQMKTLVLYNVKGVKKNKNLTEEVQEIIERANLRITGSSVDSATWDADLDGIIVKFRDMITGTITY